MTPTPTIPGASLRLGVSGTRALDQPQIARLTAQLTDLLRTIAQHAARHRVAPPRLHLLSPLAEGADRLVAEVALAENFSLTCPMPFPQADYETDFHSDESCTHFHTLLARALNRVALDGARGDAEAFSYEAVGRLVVRNCDLLIAIWDGKPGKGRGGTRDTVHHAASFGPPIICLHPTDPDAAPRWIEGAHDLRFGAEPRPVEPALGTYLTRLLQPPAAPKHAGHHSVLHRIGRALHAIWSRAIAFVRRRAPDPPLLEFLREQPNPVPPWARLHGWLMKLMAAGRKPPTGEFVGPPQDALARHWYDLYAAADQRAGECAARYRSSYVWAFILAAIALSAAATGLGAPGVEAGAIAVEFVTLAGIAFLVIADGVAGWQRRAIEYRLLAELCRKQQALAPLAWAVPRASAWATSAPDRPPEPDAPPADQSDWVAWLFSAWLRDAPPPAGSFDAARVGAARTAAVRDLIDEQVEYHTRRRAQSYRAGRRLQHLGEALFALVLLVVAAKLWLLEKGAAPDAMFWLGLAGAILPALSAALVGIRAYAELELLAEQSDLMLRAMRRARTQITQLCPAAPLASQALGRALATVATLMLEDLQGWARLFRAKAVEA